ncbi:hypothetical protein DFH07DRAFT_96882 [Mycena maculata]|uniref:Golgi apparatus membrane protein TVP38 n=1 Tax=Mycena maculata TaxID=230809 RepID=A0AAD7I8T0_9AGAR|nr:hypothetical protein DFH07DRAFT_96882 [Mycena maculata]
MSSQTIAEPAPYPPKRPEDVFNSDIVNVVSLEPAAEDPRNITRTPSPTLSEFNAMNDIQEKRPIRQRILYYGIIAAFLTAILLFGAYHNQIIRALQPVSRWLLDHKFGPVIPVAMLIIVSFPPLVGHELIATLAGVVWSFPIAFLIVAVGTLLGEIANYFTFKYACSARGAKMEAKNIRYGLLAHVVRSGRFWIVLVIRLSAIPPHFSTTVFSTVGILFVVFAAATILSLPKQAIAVFVGYSLKASSSGSRTSKLVELLILGISIVVTIVAYWWMTRKMKAARLDYIHSRRRARQAKLVAANVPDSTVPFRPDVQSLGHSWAELNNNFRCPGSPRGLNNGPFCLCQTIENRFFSRKPAGLWKDAKISFFDPDTSISVEMAWMLNTLGGKPLPHLG